MNLPILQRAGAVLCALLAALTLHMPIQTQEPQQTKPTPEVRQVMEPELEQVPNGWAQLSFFDETEERYLPAEPYEVIRVLVEGEELTGAIPAFLHDGQTFFPLDLAEAMGATVEWQDSGYEIVVRAEKTELVFTLGSPTVLVNGEERTLADGAAPHAVAVPQAEEVAVPLRFLARSLGYLVAWEDETRTVNLTVDPDFLAGPLTGFLVALDAGHGGWSPGAEYENIYEKDINLSVTLLTAQALEEKGCEVFLVRKDDEFIDIYDRGDMANAVGADLFVSIHSNASDVSSTFQGIYTYYYPGSRTGEALAKVIQNAVIQATGSVDRGTLSDKFVVLRKSNMPAVLVEMGFMSCHQELMRLIDPDYQMQIAQGIAQGVEDYLTK